MSQLNLVLRFGLELAGIVALGIWGYGVTASPGRFILAVGVPLALVVVWATVVAPGATNPIPPTVRELIGSALLLVAAVALYAAGYATAAVVFAVLVVLNTIGLLVFPDHGVAARSG